ncbi:MAG: 23S rRNA (guanosine(2251)-2'-O)-methyltransferase RlmB [Nitrospinota bacterium]
MSPRRPSERVCGVHAVRAALEKGRALRVFLAPTRGGGPAAQVQALAEDRGVPIEIQAPEILADMASTRQHQGMVAEVRPLKLLSIEEFLAAQPPHRPPVLVLDGIQDPRNLGALLRTAAALGAGGAVWPKDGAAGLTPTAAKAAAGALEVLPLARVTNLVRALESMKKQGYWAIAADPRGEAALGERELPQPAALVLGAEGRGVRRLVRETCDLGVRIPQSQGIVGSLNVAVAAGVFLFCLTASRSAPAGGAGGA